MSDKFFIDGHQASLPRNLHQMPHMSEGYRTDKTKMDIRLPFHAISIRCRIWRGGIGLIKQKWTSDCPSTQFPSNAAYGGGVSGWTFMECPSGGILLNGHSVLKQLCLLQLHFLEWTACWTSTKYPSDAEDAGGISD